MGYSEMTLVRTCKGPERIKSCRAKTYIYCRAFNFCPAVINWIHIVVALCHSLKLRPYSIPQHSNVSPSVSFIYTHIKPAFWLFLC